MAIDEKVIEVCIPTNLSWHKTRGKWSSDRYTTESSVADMAKSKVDDGSVGLLHREQVKIR